MQTAVAFTLAYPYGYPQVLSSYHYSRHGDGPPREAVHGEGGTLNCGDGAGWVCQHQWPEIANMVGPAHCSPFLPAVHAHSTKMLTMVDP